ncbi:ABC transporter ATP-binding protein [Candidatus Roseilinea sp. NK_OTU-006]|jgi:NitT/TauT family transport system ATP-binding protein|uniref:ABC transporter ATP-binding protein n=1 Tax=Candidatus Roseilinea sp. NK_OTU-006 TaxID=2704250 RepID=UPI00145E6B17|nr:ABC transporter ATP-binding protein [Candidatus Roseilinea sp. NK_OTU-006]
MPLSNMIELHHVRKLYPPRSRHGQPVLAVADVTFDVARGEFVSIVGPSGCGKSTLVKMLAGLMDITAGEIYVNGQPVCGPHSDIGIVFQTPTLLKWRSVLDNVLLPLDILRKPRLAFTERAEELLRLVGLWDFRNDYPSVLSGGMQQRAALCRALIHDPSLLVMDEPFGALDAFTREEMNLELLKLWAGREAGRQKTIVFITHSIPEAVLLSDRVIVFSPRPGTVDSIFEINLPRPRTADLQYSEQFQAYARNIRSRIGVAANAAVAQQNTPRPTRALV